jgi:hypothetical protein
MNTKNRVAEHFSANGNDALQLESPSSAYLASEALLSSRDAEDHAAILQRRNEKNIVQIICSTLKQARPNLIGNSTLSVWQSVKSLLVEGLKLSGRFGWLNLTILAS